MRIYEVFIPDDWMFIGEDAEASLIAANKNIATSQQQKVNAEISKLNTKISDKKKKLSSLAGASALKSIKH